MKNENDTKKTSINIPGTVFEALVNNGLILDPFYGNNEHKVSQIYNENWIFEKKFDIEEELLNYSGIILQFDGVDTISQVELNGKVLGTTENMFLRYEFNITDVLKAKDNILKVYIKSPTSAATQKVKEFKINLKNFEGVPGVPYLRKAQYSFGWDWGPCLPDIGIWKSVNLIFFEDIRIDSYYIDLKFNYNSDPSKITDTKNLTSLMINSVKINIQINLRTSLNRNLKERIYLKCNLTAPDKISHEKTIIIQEQFPSIEFQIDFPYLWWTHDLGIPNLYDLEISIEQNGRIIDSKKEKVGLRDIKLIRKPDNWGETFYFQLNGMPLFAKGANWIPIDSFIPRGRNKGLIELNIENALEANMNMIRVWGGGVYEDDLFYKTCDEKGILVWQDFPFACAVYPIHKEFIENVKEEAIYNIKRLRNHPSLAFWCGNNEIEQLWKFLLQISGLINPDIIKNYEEGYLTLFKDILPNLIKEYDPRHQYWPSSALDKFEGSKILSSNPNNPESGDSHYWYVWHGGASFKSYRTFDSRFMSEFGFESFPSMKTIKNFCPTEQLHFDSHIMENHQKNRAGNKKIHQYMKKRFGIPKKFEQQVILSQLTQAEAIEYGVEHWRRNRNEYHCMGTLYWQLNDCWPVASWSSFDYYGRWKALHYYAKRFYTPLFPSVREENDKVEYWITNDLRTSENYILEWKIFNSTNELLKKDFYEGIISPCSSKLLGIVNVEDINNSKEKAQQNIIFYTLKKDKSDTSYLYHGMKLFGAPKKIQMQDPKITWDFILSESGNTERVIKIKIVSEKIAYYVYIDSDVFDFKASDNFFSMGPGESRVITLWKLNPLDKSQMGLLSLKKEHLYVRSLFDLIS